VAGGGFFPLEKKTFESIRLALTAIPDTSPSHTVAAECLGVVMADNAAIFRGIIHLTYPQKRASLGVWKATNSI
jgi:hypothetical protein